MFWFEIIRTVFQVFNRMVKHRVLSHYLLYVAQRVPFRSEVPITKRCLSFVFTFTQMKNLERFRHLREMEVRALYYSGFFSSHPEKPWEHHLFIRVHACHVPSTVGRQGKERRVVVKSPIFISRSMKVPGANVV